VVVASDPPPGFAATRVVGGLVFTLGLTLVMVGGAELFTGNNLIVMAWASGKVSTRTMPRNSMIVWFGNLVGALGLVVLGHRTITTDRSGHEREGRFEEE
jgi:formate transporter